jgi:hypothetical protein
MAFSDSFKGLGRDLTGLSSPLMGMDSVLIRLADDMAKEFRNYMQENNINVTESISSSIGALPVKIYDRGVEIDIVALPAYNYIDEGVDGVERSHGSRYSFKSIKPFSIQGIESLKTWYAGKGLPSVPDYNSIAYGMSVNIKKRGIEPKRITEGVLNKGLINDLTEALSQILGESMEITFDKAVKKWQ